MLEIFERADSILALDPGSPMRRGLFYPGTWGAAVNCDLQCSDRRSGEKKNPLNNNASLEPELKENTMKKIIKYRH